MVRLAARSFLHMLPEEVDEGFDHPFYAQVLRINNDIVTFRSLEGGEGVVSRNVAVQHVVSSREVRQAGELSLLRRSVAVDVDVRMYYGQVIAITEDSITVDSKGHQFVAATYQASPVPPIVALLLQHVEFNLNDWSHDDLEELQVTIMNRVLGRNGETASNAIEDVMHGIMDEETFPVASELCRWINPSSGRPTEFPLQHALDYAYFVDGGRTPVPDSVGQSFCQPPAQRVRVNELQVSNDALELFDPFVDDDEHEITEPESILTNNSNPARSLPVKRYRDNSESVSVKNQHQSSQKHQRVSYHSALDKDASIVELLRDDPDLLNHFLKIRRSNANKSPTSANTDDKCSNVGTRQSAVRTSDPRSKYAFAPRQDQQYIHDQVTAEKHKGKSPSVFVCGMVRSHAVEFKALPGVCTRAYDIRFGSKGLSIRHFTRISHDDRVGWLESGGSNFDNLSASAEFTKAPPAECLEDVIDAARVFLVYAREYCCEQLISLTENIVQFLDGTLKRVTWNRAELPYVVYWVNDVLEDFREAIAARSDISQVRQRCSTEDRLLRDLMFVKLHRQVDELKHLQATTALHRTKEVTVSRERTIPARETRTIREPTKPRFGRIPKHVLRRLPVQVDPATGENRQLCMRYLSNEGCIEDSSGCPSGRGHFVPKKLPEVVKQEITKRFGGMKQEYGHL